MQIDLSPHLLSTKKDLEHSYKKSFQRCVLGQAHTAVGISDIVKGLFMSRFGCIPQMSKYLRAQIGIMIIHSSEYTAPTKSCSCYVKMCDASYCLVVGIYAVEGTMYLHCQQLLTPPSVFDVPRILQCQLPPPSANNFFYCSEEVALQCVFFNVHKQSYPCELPNRLEKN